MNEDEKNKYLKVLTSYKNMEKVVASSLINQSSTIKFKVPVQEKY